ncbi:hypothetical protein KIH74_34650 [Kineosporia sp. J2-2]|uniref:Inhibitor I9 domain-containing protein n=1 Tax=Kineosporia corallincola TaxID=2835133 RepID=A0ABS5TTJ8_9ACTN|nr:hypothetical protein [Kineosporia corallincola]MBT0774137.1 hypothetical protein [Kineosporia corallincola]
MSTNTNSGDPIVVQFAFYGLGSQTEDVTAVVNELLTTGPQVTINNTTMKTDPAVNVFKGFYAEVDTPEAVLRYVCSENETVDLSAAPFATTPKSPTTSAGPTAPDGPAFPSLPTWPTWPGSTS